MKKTITTNEKEKLWEIKDRTYVMSGKSSLTYTIQSRHTRRKPLLYFDDVKNQNRELRYATNQNSVFVDEQDGFATLGQVMFDDGILHVPRQNQQLQKLLSLYHPKASEAWVEINKVKEAVDELKVIEFELKAQTLVAELEIDHLEAIMRSSGLGSLVANLTAKELKRDGYRFAKSNPKLFIDLAEDEDILLRNVANRAVERGILKLTDNSTVFKWNNGKKLITVPFDENAYSALAQYFKTDEGVDVLKSIEKKLKA